jgi:asparagine synthase (glutamine-hydrolysing)
MVLDQERNERERWRTMARRVLAVVARQSALDRFLALRGGGRLDRLRTDGGFVARYANLYQIFGSVGAARLLSPALRGPAGAGRAPERDVGALDGLPGGSAIERVTALCLRGYTANQLLRDIDAVSMAHSLEVRVPYLDAAVVDLALSLPDRAKLGSLDGVPTPEQNTYRATGAKRILVDTGRPLLPDGFDLQPKRGFGMPFDAWLRGPLREVLLDTLSETAVRCRGLLDPRQVAATCQGFLEGAHTGWAQPWLLMMLELWSREVLDRSPAALGRGFGGGSEA